MRKFTILLGLVLFASFAMAQFNNNYGIVANNAGKTKKAKATKEESVWQVNFEEATPVWTFGQAVGTKAWVVDDTTSSSVTYVNGDDFDDSSIPAGTEVTAVWLYTGHRDVGEYSESGGNFAWVDGITDLLTGNVQTFETWIQFDNINLTTVNNPKLKFYQNYKVYNSDECYVDFSEDGGTTWNSVRINEKTSLGGVNHYADEEIEIIATDYIANSSNVSIRFRWLCTSDDAAYGSGYGWQIDDINIVETPVYDAKFSHGRMSFFEYYDYTDPSYADYNVYQISGYYGNIPQAEFDSEYSNCWFNVAAQNLGVESITPVANVEIFDPEMNSIFTNTVTGVAIATNETDTIDLIESDFTLGANPAVGEYTVVYTVSIDGQEDLVAENNVDTAYFNITEDYFGRDVEGPTSSHSLNNSSAGGIDGEQFGQTFMFLWEAEVTSVDIFIDATTSTAANIILNAYQYDSDASSYVLITQSPLTTITDDDLGNWKNMEFTDDLNIVFDEGESGKEILFALEMYYNGDNEVWIGYDTYDYVDAVYNHGFYTKYDGDDTWYYGGLNGGLSMRINFNNFCIGCSDVPQEFADNLNIYPNPTTGILNIEGIEGADIQILNMMGQVVESVENIDEYSQVDMSRYANGTYFVKVIVDNNVVTRKINLMR